MSRLLNSQAKVLLNVRVVVGNPDSTGAIKPRVDKKFKNTATRIMTESICNYLAGSENTYKRGHGRPNYMSVGTMGIVKQPCGSSDTAEVETGFSDITHSSDSTRPWFESTSLALTNVCGSINSDSEGVSTHFWDPTLGWGKDGFTGDPSDEPIFQGELCTADVSDITKYDIIDRFPILRADVLSDCPADWDFGVDGYCSQVIFYGYMSVEKVHRLLKPSHTTVDASTGVKTSVPVGPQLDRMAISEFGLYEKSNEDAHGLETMLAGFRVPTEDDLIYVTDGEVILVEWRVSVRALMPYEAVGWSTDIAAKPKGISLNATLLGEDASHNKYVKFKATIIPVNPEYPIDDSVTWTLRGGDGTERSSGLVPSPEVPGEATLTVLSTETDSVLYVTATSVLDPTIISTVAVLTSIISDYIIGIQISATVDSEDMNSIQFTADVIGKGTFSHDVTWSIASGDEQSIGNTTINAQSGLATIDPTAPAREMKVTATSVGNSNIYAASVILRIGEMEGNYVISDFTILT